MLTGDPGSGKSIALRLLAERLRALPDVLVGTVEHPQSRTMDFYRELGDLFGVPLASTPSTAGPDSKPPAPAGLTTSPPAAAAPSSSSTRLQETLSTVLCELRILASKDLDSKQLLCVVFAGDARLPERLRSPDLLPLGSRIRRRLTLELRLPRRGLAACLDHLLAAAGNPSLMTSELRVTLADHAAGNYRVLAEFSATSSSLSPPTASSLRLDESSSSRSSPRPPRPSRPPPHRKSR